MPEYEIKGWNPIILPGQTFPMPSIYIKPGDDFVKYAQENNNSFLVKIIDNSSPYNGKNMLGVINVEDCRPNFYKDTDYVPIILDSDWKGYPSIPNNGKAQITGSSEIKLSEPPPYQAPQPLPWNAGEFYEKDKVRTKTSTPIDNLNFSQTLTLLLTIIAIFGSLLVFGK